MSRPKILIWHWGRRGGGPRYTFELARALMQQGTLDIHLSLSRQSEIFDEFAALGAPGFHVNTYRGLFSAALATARVLFLRRRFWRYVAANDIDLVVCSMSHVWNVPILIGRRNKTPYLMVLHDALPHPGDDVPLRHALLAREIEEADGVVALTEHVRCILCKQYNYPPVRSWVVPHGVFPYAAPAMAVPPSTALRLLFFGRILPYKGLGMLLTAYHILREEGRAIQLVICGAGDLAPYADGLKNREGMTLDNRWIAEAEIGPIFQQADVVVLPYIEASQSGVIATAYAAGVPVIVTPIGGLVEQVKHEETGLISSAVSAEAMAEALRRMIDDPALRIRCAQGARREAEEALSWGNVANQFTEAMVQMLPMGKK